MEKQPRISTYVDEETITKFKIVAALNGKSMSKYLEDLIQEKIKEYNVEEISANSTSMRKTYLLHNIRYQHALTA